MSSLPPLPERFDLVTRSSDQWTPSSGFAVIVSMPVWSEADMRAYGAACVAAEKDRILALSKSRADYEADAAAHHAGRWPAAYETHLTRHSAMRDLIDVIRTTE